MQEQRPAVSDAEREVLKILWERGPSTVREVQEALDAMGQGWTRSTVITLLQRLEKKGYAASDKSKFAFVFRAAVSRQEVMHERLVELAGEFCGGDAVPLVLAFAQKHRFTEEELQRFRAMIDAMENKRRKRSAP